MEILFEWELLVNIRYVNPAMGYQRSLRGTAITMLVAHWLYWSAAIIEALSPKEDKYDRMFKMLDKDGSGVNYF